MSFTHTLTQVWAQGNNSISQQVSKSADGETNRDVTVPENSTDLLVNFTLDVSELKALYIVSDKAMTIQVNSGSSPSVTLTLVANEPLVWWTGSSHANPFSSTDVTALYLTTGAVGEAILKIRALHDSTP